MKDRFLQAILTAMLILILLPLDIFAATGTITGSNINARAEPSTSGAVLGVLNSGDTFEINGTSTDASGATWYMITLSSGSTAYVRSDFMRVTDDQQTQQTPTELPEYQIVLANDSNGESAYYLYYNRKGTRIKLSDVDAYQNELRQLKKEMEENTKKGKTRVIIVLILFILVIASIVAMYLKMMNMAQDARRTRSSRLRQEPSGEERRDPNLTRSGQKPAPTRRRPAAPSPSPKTVKVATPSDEQTQTGNISFFDTTSFGQTGKLSQSGRLNQTGRLSETGPIKQDTGSLKAAEKKSETAKPVPSYLEDFFDE